MIGPHIKWKEELGEHSQKAVRFVGLRNKFKNPCNKKYNKLKVTQKINFLGLLRLKCLSDVY